MPHLENRTCLVTGAASGIGRAVAMTFAAAGARVVLADINLGGAREAAAGLSLAAAVELDVADSGSWAKAVAQAAGRFGPPTVLANVAGIARGGDRLDDLTVPVWQEIFAVNALGPVLGAQHVVPHMRAAGGGSIINVASIRAELGTTDGSGLAYGASKAAVAGLTRSLAAALGRDGIRVNAIAPAVVETPMTRGYGPAARAARLARYPLGRFGTTGDVAELALFLASDAASWMSGEILHLDGGAAATYV